MNRNSTLSVHRTNRMHRAGKENFLRPAVAAAVAMRVSKMSRKRTRRTVVSVASFFNVLRHTHTYARRHIIFPSLYFSFPHTHTLACTLCTPARTNEEHFGCYLCHLARRLSRRIIIFQQNCTHLSASRKKNKRLSIQFHGNKMFRNRLRATRSQPQTNCAQNENLSILIVTTWHLHICDQWFQRRKSFYASWNRI